MSWLDRLARDMLYDNLVRDPVFRAQWLFLAKLVVVLVMTGGRLKK